MEMYRQIEGITHAKISVDYRLGGLNYFSGRQEPRGIVVSFTTVEKEGYSEKYTPMDSCNYRIFIKEMKRKSQKKIDKVCEIISQNSSELFDFYIDGNKDMVWENLQALRPTIERI